MPLPAVLDLRPEAEVVHERRREGEEESAPSLEPHEQAEFDPHAEQGYMTLEEYDTHLSYLEHDRANG